MNTPSYIVQRNNQFMVDFKPLHERMGFNRSEFSPWFRDRIQKMNLVEGADFERAVDNRITYYYVPVDKALPLLNTVSKTKSEPIKQELKAFLSQTSGDETAIDEEAQKKPVVLTNGGSLSLFQSQPEKPVVVQSAPLIPVMRIEGRAAVQAADVMACLSKMPVDRLELWFAPKITNLRFALGKHYVEYALPPKKGQKRTHSEYILSIDAAIAIADSEHKNRAWATHVSDSLKDYREGLAKQKLSTKGLLSDFIGMKPEKPATDEPQPVEPVIDSPDEETPAQPPIFTNPVPVESVVPLPLAEVVAEPDSMDTPDSNSPEIEGFKNDDGDPVITDEDQPETLPIEDQAQPIFDFMVQMAQGLLKQAQALADHQKAMKAMQSTLWMLVSIEQQTALQKLGLHKGVVSMPTQTMRDKIKAAVHKRATATGEKHEDIFKLIYKRLHYDYGWNVSALPREKGETHLGLCERCGILEYVWAVVDSRAFNAYAVATPAQS